MYATLFRTLTDQLESRAREQGWHLRVHREAGQVCIDIRDGTHAVLTELTCPWVGLHVNGLGRFQFELSEDSALVENMLVAISDPPAARFQLEVAESGVAVARWEAASGHPLEVVGTAWTAIAAESDDFQAMVVALTSYASSVAGLRTTIVPEANRVLLVNAHGMCLAFDHAGGRLANWSIEPLAGPELEVDVFSESSFVRMIVDAVARDAVEMSEQRRFGGRSIVAVIHRLDGPPLRIRSPWNAVETDCRNASDYPWVRLLPS